MSFTLDAIALPIDLTWSDEYGGWTPVEQEEQFTLTGALVIQTAIKAAGRPITLTGGWATKAQLDALNAKLASNAVMTLTLQDARTFQVRFANKAAPLIGNPVEPYAVQEATDLYELTLKFITV